MAADKDHTPRRQHILHRFYNTLFHTTSINYNAAWAKILLILQNKINNPLGMETDNTQVRCTQLFWNNRLINGVGIGAEQCDPVLFKKALVNRSQRSALEVPSNFSPKAAATLNVTALMSQSAFFGGVYVTLGER